MSLLNRLLLITFIESLATICVERGIYFFGAQRLGFSDTENLWLALAFGVAYVIGSISSHKTTLRLTEKRLLNATILAQLLVHLGLAKFQTSAGVFVGATLIGWLNGLKWPVVESYVSAGQSPAQVARAIGRFNVSWASAVPLTLAVAGKIIEVWPAGLFIIPAAINAVSLLLVKPLEAHPLHLPAGHPDRPSPSMLSRYARLLTASRWLMIVSYASLWVLAALMPRIFGADRLGFSVAAATALSGVVDVMRVTAFIILGQWRKWHGKGFPIALGLLGLPVGFLMVLFGANVYMVLAGELLFGFMAGMIYFAALYYAMVVQNASVDAGGAHEGLIGLGFAIGPAAGLIGVLLMPVLHNYPLAILAGIGPVFVLCSIGAVRAMNRTLAQAAS